MYFKFNNFYNGKTVLITGATGFKGSWLSIWLKELGANVIGYSLNPKTNNDNFVLAELSKKIIDIRGDIRDYSNLKEVFNKYKPDYVFHMAAQPLVEESYLNPILTYEINLMGTLNILECIKNSDRHIVGIFITTDKCYSNKEQVWGYKETDSLGGHDPYSSSKAACEIAINSWRESYMSPALFHKHGKAISSVRSGNVIGGGDWSEKRIIPDCIKALENNIDIILRSPNSIRPWQYVLEPLYGYLLLGQKMQLDPVKYSDAWNFGPKIDSVVDVKYIVEMLIKNYGKGHWRCLENSIFHETKMLNLDVSKAIFELGWKPTLSIDDALKFTSEWYQKYNCSDVYKLCIDQINDFTSLIK